MITTDKQHRNSVQYTTLRCRICSGEFIGYNWTLCPDCIRKRRALFGKQAAADGMVKTKGAANG